MRNLEQLTDFDLLWALKISECFGRKEKERKKTDGLRVGKDIESILSARHKAFNGGSGYEEWRNWFVANNIISHKRAQIIENAEMRSFDNIQETTNYIEKLAAMALEKNPSDRDT